ncbi:MAG: hypothetical protein AAFX08_07960 [Pseudomonadota bacterium]
MRHSFASPRRRTARAVLAAALALGVAACGGGEEPQGVSRKAARARSIAASPSAPSPLDEPFRLRNAETVDVDRLLAIFPETLRPTYAAAVFDEDLGAMVLTDVTVPAVKAKAEGAINYDVEFAGLKADRVELFGADPEAIEAVIAGESSIEAPMRRVLTKARFYGVRGPEMEGAAKKEDVDATIAAIEIAGLSAREGGLPPAPPKRELRGSTYRATKAADQDGAGLARLLHAFSADGLYMKDAALVARDKTDAGEPLFETRLPDVRFVGVEGGRLQAMIINDFSSVTRSQRVELDTAAGLLSGVTEALEGPFRNVIAPDLRKVTIARIEWKDVDASGFMPFALTGETPPTTARDLMDFGAIAVRGSQTHVNGALFSSIPLSEVTAIEFDWVAPSRIRARAEDVFYDFTALFGPEEEEAREFLTSLSLNGVEGDTEFSYDWDAKDGVARLMGGSAAPGFAASEFDLELVDMKLDDLDPAAAAQGFDGLIDAASLARLDAKLVDETALDAIFGVIGIEGGFGGKNARATLTTLLGFVRMQAGFGNPQVGEYVDALVDFIDDGGTLTVTARPDTPAPLSALEGLDGAEAAARLNLQVTHEK